MERKVRESAAKAVGNRGKGRKKGVPNKLTKSLKDMILGALSDVGGRKYLASCARKQPKAFLALLGRVLPTEVSGVEGGPVTVTVRYEDS